MYDIHYIRSLIKTLDETQNSIRRVLKIKSSPSQSILTEYLIEAREHIVKAQDLLAKIHTYLD